MKVIVLAKGGTERSLIQAALDKARHQPVLAEDPQDVVRLIKTGQGRVVIADEDGLDVPTQNLIALLRAPDLPPTYILMLISGDRDLVDSDDILKKPFAVTDLVSRLQVAQRFLSLGDRISRLNQQLQTMALYDGITGLMNRTAFLRTAQGELERARRAAAPLSIIALELDDYDLPGVGGAVLAPAAQIIKEKSRPYDCVGRWSGGQFLVTLPHVIGDDARNIAVRILKGIRAAPIAVGTQSRAIKGRAAVVSVLRVGTATELEPLIHQALLAIPRGMLAEGEEVVLAYA